MKKLVLLMITFLSLTPLFAQNAQENSNGVDRYAIFIGSNKGGKDSTQLLYAGSDAVNFQKTMSEIGGINDSNSYVLIDPTKESVDLTLNKITNQIKSSQSTAKRSEFLFYYSGHSDENALLLGDVSYDYSSLKAAITEVPSDIHVVILDSCYSGNFIRTKGGQKRKPFLLDDSSVVKGHAYLSSSSDNEVSQESNEIESSFFTNAMITGLRGAADASGDNKVTLNELYSYAFNDTLSKTEESRAGPQHPNYNITLVGSGDLILSDISTADAMLSLSKDAKGKFIIRNSKGKLISEINKNAGQPIYIGLPSDQYSAVIIDEYSTKQGYFNLAKDQVYVLDQNSLATIKRKSNRIRGNGAQDYEEEVILAVDDLEALDENEIADNRNTNQNSESDSEKKTSSEDDKMSYFHLAFVPGFNFVGGNKEDTLFSVGILGSKVQNLKAIQYSPILNIATGSVYGGQFSGVANITKKEVNGIQGAGVFNITPSTINGFQGAGVFNIAKEIHGIQGAGNFNIVSKDVYGFQGAGVFNLTGGNVHGFQGAGVFNITGGEVQGFQGAGVFNYAKKVDAVQAAGVANIANEVEVGQIAGVFNGAKKVKKLQIGLINYAEENDGVAIGLINIIKNGMHHVGFYWDTNDMFDIYLQTGTQKLFVTLGAAQKRTTLFKNEVPAISYVGLGTEFRIGFTSLDVEVLSKFVNLKKFGTYHGFYKEEDDSEHYSGTDYFIHGARVTWNFLRAKHFELNLGATVDVNVHGYNDRAFELIEHKWGGGTDDFELYPSCFLGFKIK
ncbi:MAG: caspase family protein [Treponema sp.]|nr:caspase family protein [Treponema sp.]